MMGYSGFGMGFGWIFMVLFWGAVIWLIAWLVKQNSAGSRQNASDILRERYARGEISRKEYDEMRKNMN